MTYYLIRSFQYCKVGTLTSVFFQVLTIYIKLKNWNMK